MKSLILMLAIASFASSTFAKESFLEKATSKARDAKRAIKKGAHRVSEEVCSGSEAECTARKVKHRATEAKDYTVDKAKDLKNKVDD